MKRRLHVMMTVELGRAGSDLNRVATPNLADAARVWVAQGIADRTDGPQVTYWVAAPEDGMPGSGSVTVPTAMWMELMRMVSSRGVRIAELEKLWGDAQEDVETLRKLEAAGVDNWEGYGEAFAGDTL